MPPPALANLYCGPQDVYDYLGTAGGQLRLDDDQLGTGQVVQVTVSAAQGATSLLVAALTYPLLAGTVLEFAGGGMPPPVTEVTLAVTAPTGSTTLTVAPLVAALPALSQAFDSGVNLATAQRLIKGCSYGTARVKLYCTPRYDDSQLVNSWSVNRWATALAAQWVARRRGLTPPSSVDQEVEETMEELRQVRTGMLLIEDIGTRTSSWPFISNTTLDIGYDYRRIRVQQPQSEGTPTQYPQAIDWQSALYIEF